MSVKSLRLTPLLVGIALLVAACSTGSVGSTTTGTPTGGQDATTILNKAQTAPLKDATFTFAFGNGASPTASPSTSGMGRLTTNPARSDLVLPSITVQGITASGEVISDQASKVYYIKVTGLSNWLKVDPASLGINLGVPNIVDYSGLQNLTYIGNESINGTPTWHIQGQRQVTQTVDGGGATLTQTANYWFRQSDYYPVQMLFQNATNASTGGNATPTPGVTVPPSIRSAATPTPSTDTPTPNPTVSAQVTFSEQITFSAWDSGFTIALPTT